MIFRRAPCHLAKSMKTRVQRFLREEPDAGEGRPTIRAIAGRCGQTYPKGTSFDGLCPAMSPRWLFLAESTHATSSGRSLRRAASLALARAAIRRASAINSAPRELPMSTIVSPWAWSRTTARSAGRDDSAFGFTPIIGPGPGVQPVTTGPVHVVSQTCSVWRVAT